MKYKCEDCRSEVDVPKDIEMMEIVVCPTCGVEYAAVVKIRKGKKVVSIKKLELEEKEDWGE